MGSLGVRALEQLPWQHLAADTIALVGSLSSCRMLQLSTRAAHAALRMSLPCMFAACRMRPMRSTAFTYAALCRHGGHAH